LWLNSITIVSPAGVTTTRSIELPLNVKAWTTPGVGAIICMPAGEFAANASMRAGWPKCAARTSTVCDGGNVLSSREAASNPLIPAWSLMSVSGPSRPV
jgi:hypothetical protein